MIISVVIGSVAPVKPTEAASKKGFYYSCLTGSYFNGYPYVKSIKLKGNKLIIKASFDKASTEKAFHSHKNTTRLKFRKRTFKLTSNCKFYSSGGEDFYRLTRKEFLYLAHQYNGLGLKLFINSKGKIYKAYISS